MVGCVKAIDMRLACAYGEHAAHPTTGGLSHTVSSERDRVMLLRRQSPYVSPLLPHIPSPNPQIESLYSAIWVIWLLVWLVFDDLRR